MQTHFVPAQSAQTNPAMFLTKPILPVNPAPDAEAMSTFQQTRTPRIWRGELKLMDNSKIQMFDLVDAPHHCLPPELLLSRVPPAPFTMSIS